MRAGPSCTRRTCSGRSSCGGRVGRDEGGLRGLGRDRGGVPAADGVRLGRLGYDATAPAIGGTKLHVFLELGGSPGVEPARDRQGDRGAGGAEHVPGVRGGGERLSAGSLEGVPGGLSVHGEGGGCRGRARVFRSPVLRAALGRWVSADPLTVHGLGGDLNAYAYVHGRVFGAVDPFGLEGELTLNGQPAPIGMTVAAGEGFQMAQSTLSHSPEPDVPAPATPAPGPSASSPSAQPSSSQAPAPAPRAHTSIHDSIVANGLLPAENHETEGRIARFIAKFFEDPPPMCGGFSVRRQGWRSAAGNRLRDRTRCAAEGAPGDSGRGACSGSGGARSRSENVPASPAATAGAARRASGGGGGGRREGAKYCEGNPCSPSSVPAESPKIHVKYHATRKQAQVQRRPAAARESPRRSIPTPP